MCVRIVPWRQAGTRDQRSRSSRSSRSINNRQVFVLPRQADRQGQSETSDPQKTCVPTQKHLNWTDDYFWGHQTNNAEPHWKRGFWLNWAFKSFVCRVVVHAIALNWKCNETHCQLNNRTSTWGHRCYYYYQLTGAPLTLDTAAEETTKSQSFSSAGVAKDSEWN